MSDIDLSGVPDSVRKQYENSMKYFKSLEDAKNGEQGEGEKESVAEQAPAKPENPPPKAEDPPKAPAAESEWEHKYKVLAGKYNAEVPRLNQEVREYKSELASLRQEVEALKQPQGPKGSLKELMDTLGAEDLQVKVISEQESKIAHLEATIAKLTAQQTQIAETQAQSEEDRFLAALGKLYPAWETVNVDPDLLIWLAEEDPLLGGTRKAAFDNAVARLDAGRVVAFFKAFESSRAPAPVAAPAKPKPSESLKKQVMPEVGAGSNGDVAGAKWTRASVSTFYSDAGKGKFTEEQVAATTKEIMDAYAKGLIAN